MVWRPGVGFAGREARPPLGPSFHLGASTWPATVCKHAAGLKPLRYVIGLGANLGARHGALQLAQRMLDADADMAVVARSGVYESPPMGPPQPDYLNAAVLVSSTLAPSALLTRLQAIEARLGRERQVLWGARTLDLDILWADEGVDGPGLTIPHRGLEARWWALSPLLDVAPFLRARYGPVLDRFAARTPARVPLELATAPSWEPVATGEGRVFVCPLPDDPAVRLDRIVAAAVGFPRLRDTGPPPELGPLQLDAGRWAGWGPWAEALLKAAIEGRQVVGAQVRVETGEPHGEPNLTGCYGFRAGAGGPPGGRLTVRAGALELSLGAPGESG